VPGYLAKAEAIAAAGIDEVVVVCVNDAAVMRSWALDMGVGDNDERTSVEYVDSDRCEGPVSFAADTHAALTGALGLVMEPIANLGGDRSLRYAAVFDDGVATHVAVSGAPGTDPAGDEYYANSCVDEVLAAVAAK